MTFAARPIGTVYVAPPPVRLSDRTITAIDVAGAPYDSGVWFFLQTNGIAYWYNREFGVTNPANPIPGEWLVSGNVSDYEVRATLQSGAALDIGTVGVWQSLSSLRTWAIVSTFQEIKQSVLLIEIRRASDQVVLDTATITLYIENAQ